MLTLNDYVKKVMNEADEPEATEPKDEKPETAKKECDTILTIECCGTTIKKIIDAIKKTEGNFKVEINTGDEENKLQIEWDGETDMIGTVKSEKKEKAD